MTQRHQHEDINEGENRDGKQEGWDKSLHGERVKENDLQEGKRVKGIDLSIMKRM